jgi:hypothetical protein
VRNLPHQANWLVPGTFHNTTNSCEGWERLGQIESIRKASKVTNYGFNLSPVEERREVWWHPWNRLQSFVAAFGVENNIFCCNNFLSLLCWCNLVRGSLSEVPSRWKTKKATIELLKVEEKRKEKIGLERRLTKGGESITAVALTENLGDLLAVVSP